MAITVTPIYQYVEETWAGTPLRNAKLVVTGLSTNAVNSVPHGLPTAPIQVDIEPTSNNNFWENQTADVTNVYIGVSNGTGSSVAIYVTY